MNTLLFAFILLVSVTTAPVQQLTQKTFHEFVDNHPHSFIYFYSASCQYCKEFTPIFDKLSNNHKLIEQGIGFAKIDALAYPNLTNLYDVYSYPTLALFQGGIHLPQYYRKDRKYDLLNEYLLKAIKPSNSEDLLKHLKNLTSQVMVHNKIAIFHGKANSKEFKVVDQVAKRDNYLSWLHIQADSPKLMLADTEITDFDSYEGIQSQINRVYARLHELNEQSWTKMAEKKKFTIFFLNKHGNKKTQELLEGLSKEITDLHFMQIDGEHEEYKPALKFLGLNDEQNIVAVDKKYDALYLCPTPYNYQTLKKFIEEASNHNIPVYLKSQKSDKPNKLTRQNYEQKMSTTQDVILFLYDRKQQISKELMKVFEYLVAKLKMNKNLLLLRCDVSSNQIDAKLGFVSKPTPRLVFFRNKMKDYPIHFSGSTISAQTIVDFIMENTTFDFEDQWAEL